MADQSLNLPASPTPTPGLPQSPQPFVFDKFETLNTKALRPAIKDEEMAWCDGFFPIGPSTLRALPGCGPGFYTPGGGRTIPFFGFGNIGANPLAIVLLSDGSVIQVNTSSGVSTVIAAPGTILNPASRMGLSQWGSQYIIFVAPQDNGFFVWDGMVLYQAGSLAPSIEITATGSGYTTATVAFTGGSGSGATGTVQLDGGEVIGITITNAGTGYLAGETVTVVISGDGSAATATVDLMPFGVRGTAVEVFESRVWITDGSRILFSAPDFVWNFNSADGAGVGTSTDSFLRVNYTNVKQTNGFLYTIADSSINYIANPSTSGIPAVTTFSNLNVDPQIGTPWKDSVQLFSRNIIFANSFGVHIIYGGAVSKISEPLDGIYNTVPGFNGFNPSSAIAGIFGIQCYMLLLPVVDSYTSTIVNKLLMFNGKKWWTSQQNRDLTFVASQEIDSVLTAWGTDGTSMFRLFADNTMEFQKVAQSKLWAGPGYNFVKTGLRLWGMLDHSNTSGGDIRVFIDNETPTSSSPYTVSPGDITWVNDANDPVIWLNNSAQTVVWFVAGLVVFGPLAVAQKGTLLGLTIVTDASDTTLLSFMLLGQNFTLRT